MPRRTVSSFLKECSSLPDKDSRVKYLHDNEFELLKIVLKYAFDRKIRWGIPLGLIDFKPCSNPDNKFTFYQKAKTLYLYMRDSKIPKPKRLEMFIELLEMIDPEDAHMLVWVKDNTDKNRKNPFLGITKQLVQKTWPDLIEW
jgi:hypothetical protein